MISHSITGLTNNWLSRKKQPKRESIGYEQANQIGIIYSYPSKAKSSAVNELIAEFTRDNKKAVSISIVDRSGFETDKSGKVIGEHQISPFGKWKNDKVTEFCQSKFDYLLCLDEEPGPLVQNILLKSVALCRIGIHNERSSGLFEMMIKPAETNDISFKMMDICKYLRQLR